VLLADAGVVLAAAGADKAGIIEPVGRPPSEEVRAVGLFKVGIDVGPTSLKLAQLDEVGTRVFHPVAGKALRVPDAVLPGVSPVVLMLVRSAL
jgi:hypothetical protein